MCNNCNCDPCNSPMVGSNNVKYDGPNLPCTGVRTCDNISVALQKVDEQICNLKADIIRLQNEINNILTTTTSTTSTTTTIPVPECPDRRVVFQICNSNASVDDNFNIYLNGYFIGSVILDSDDQVGSVFIADTNPAVIIETSDFVCPLSKMVTYRFDPSILQSSNVLEMRNIQDNGNGNFGTIGVRNYLLTGTELSFPCIITDLTFSGTSGESFTFNFDYTRCCE